MRGAVAPRWQGGFCRCPRDPPRRSLMGTDTDTDNDFPQWFSPKGFPPNVFAQKFSPKVFPKGFSPMAPLYLDGEIATLRTVSSAPTIITLTLHWMQQPMRRSHFIMKLVSFLTRCFGSRHNELMILETKRLYNVCILYPVHCTL